MSFNLDGRSWSWGIDLLATYPGGLAVQHRQIWDVTPESAKLDTAIGGIHQPPCEILLVHMGVLVATHGEGGVVGEVERCSKVFNKRFEQLKEGDKDWQSRGRRCRGGLLERLGGFKAAIL